MPAASSPSPSRSGLLVELEKRLVRQVGHIPEPIDEGHEGARAGGNYDEASADARRPVRTFDGDRVRIDEVDLAASHVDAHGLEVTRMVVFDHPNPEHR